jgi:hypothetical protein
MPARIGCIVALLLLPAGALAAPLSKLLDLSTGCGEKSYYVVLAARGGSATGHALVIWGTEDNAKARSTIRALGLYPEGDRDSDNCASTVHTVPGGLMDELHNHSVDAITEELIVRVDRADFERTRRVAAEWDCRHQFSLLSRDCVAFLRAIGNSLGLPMPSRMVWRWTPPAYVKSLLASVSRGSQEIENGVYLGSMVDGKPLGRGLLVRPDGSWIAGAFPSVAQPF